RDNRISSFELHVFLVEGISSAGASVIDLGIVPLPLLRFAMRGFPVCIGVLVTGGNLSVQHNGIILEASAGKSAKNEMKKIISIFRSRGFSSGNGRIERKSFNREYFGAAAKSLGKPEKKLKIIADSGNSASGNFLVKLLRIQGHKVFPVNCSPDGTFPNHLPEPEDEKNTAELRKEILRRKAGIGFALDCNAERVVAFDSRGKKIPKNAAAESDALVFAARLANSAYKK
ncbi:MAG: hypothetical protein WC602_02675, partial [archaeon]